MGLFRRQPKQPRVHPEVHRTLFVAAEPVAVAAAVARHDDLQSKHAAELVAGVRHEAGWTALDLPSPLHPWAFHDLAMWLLDTANVLAVSGPVGAEAGYWLVNDEVGDWLSGYDDRGAALTVEVPMGHTVRGDDPGHPPRTNAQIAAALGVPSGLAGGGGTTGEPLALRLEDPGHDLNPDVEATVKNRKRLAARSFDPTATVFTD